MRSIQALGHLIEVEWPKREQLQDAPAILVSQYIQKLDRVYDHN